MDDADHTPLTIIKMCIFKHTYIQLPMSSAIEKDLINYYHHFCELTIWFRKIVLQSSPDHHITIQDITEEFIAERNRVLLYFPLERRRVLRKELNKVATNYYSRVSQWSRTQKITTHMV